MLKHKRKANKAALIANSLAYGAALKFKEYGVFKWLSKVHGRVKAGAMIAAALTTGSTTGKRIQDPGGFVVWSNTPHCGEWATASEYYDEVHGLN